MKRLFCKVLCLLLCFSQVLCFSTVSTYGIHLPDQMPVFNKYGVLLFKLTKDQSYVIDASCDEIKCPYKEKSLMFN